MTMTPAPRCSNSRCDNVQASLLQSCLDHFRGVVDRNNMSGDTGLLSPGEHCEAACLKPNLLTCRNPNNLILLAKSSLRCRNISILGNGTFRQSQCQIGCFWSLLSCLLNVVTAKHLSSCMTQHLTEDKHSKC